MRKRVPHVPIRPINPRALESFDTSLIFPHSLPQSTGNVRKNKKKRKAASMFCWRSSSRYSCVAPTYRILLEKDEIADLDLRKNPTSVNQSFDFRVSITIGWSILEDVGHLSATLKHILLFGGLLPPSKPHTEDTESEILTGFQRWSQVRLYISTFQKPWGGCFKRSLHESQPIVKLSFRKGFRIPKIRTC